MIDANTHALNSYLSEQEKQEKSLESLENFISDDLKELEEMINKIEAVAKDYENYDFSYEIKEQIKDLI